MIRRAIILAAGRGSRMGNSLPKPLVPVRGLPLAVRSIRMLELLGITEITVIVGYRATEIIGSLQNAALFPGTKVEFVENRRYDLPNGVSLRAAGSFIRERTLLLMADHVFAPQMLAPLIDLPHDGEETVLAIDRDIGLVFDLDDATKVRTRRGRLVEIGKELEPFDAVDTGLFAVSPRLVRALEGLSAPQLSDGVRALAREGAVRVQDVTGGRWVDVDNPVALLHAEWLLRRYGDALGGAIPLSAERQA